MAETRRATFLRLGLLAAAGTAFAPARVRAADVVRLAGVPSDDMTPIVYGQHAGIFARYGLDVQLTKMNNGASVAAGVLGGAFDFGKATMTTVFDAHLRGVPFTCVTPSIVYDAKQPYAAFILPKDSPIASGKDFNGQLVGVSGIGDIGSLGLRAWVEQHGGDPATIKFVEVPLSAALAALDTHRVIAAETSQPSFGTAMATGRVRAITANDAIAPTFLLAAWITTADFSTKHPDVVRAFGRAWAESATYTNAHHAETVSLMAEFTGAPVAVVEHMNRALAGTVVQASQIQPVIDAAAKYGAIAHGFSARDLIDPNAVTGA